PAPQKTRASRGGRPGAARALLVRWVPAVYRAALMQLGGTWLLAAFCVGGCIFEAELADAHRLESIAPGDVVYETSTASRAAEIISESHCRRLQGDCAWTCPAAPSCGRDFAGCVDDLTSQRLTPFDLPVGSTTLA